MTYDPRQTFSAQQSAFGRASGVTSNANQQAANTMRSSGGGRNMSGIGSRSTPKKTTPTFMERFASIFKRSGGNTSPKAPPKPNPAKLYERGEFNVTIPDTSNFMSPMERRRIAMAEQAERDRGTPGFRIYDYGTNPDNTNFVRPMPRPFFGGPSDPDPRKDASTLQSAPSPELRTTGVDEGMKEAINRSVAQAQSAAKVHTVKKGDTLTKLAKDNNTTIQAIVEANGIVDPDLIKVDQTLVIPPKPVTMTGLMSRPDTYADNEDPDSQFYQSGVPLDQRVYPPEGEPYVPVGDYEGTPDNVVMGTVGQHSGKFKTKDEFLKTMIPVAKVVADQTGLDYRMIVAQAAIETGWGSKVKGNAFFGIKGHGASNTIDFKTQEEVDGKRVTQTDSFRAYDNIGDAAIDYGRFLQDNPRYSEYLAANNLEDAASALQASGYATDSKYGDKVLTTARGRTIRNFLEKNPEYK